MRKRNAIARKMKMMLNKIEGTTRFESPLAIYEWFIKQLQQPLREDALREAYLAAWAVSIDRGMVKL